MSCVTKGLTVPDQKHGYHAQPKTEGADEYNVYLCAISAHCPAGPANQCGYGRDNSFVACGRCPDR